MKQMQRTIIRTKPTLLSRGQCLGQAVVDFVALDSCLHQQQNTLPAQSPPLHDTHFVFNEFRLYIALLSSRPNPTAALHNQQWHSASTKNETEQSLNHDNQLLRRSKHVVWIWGRASQGEKGQGEQAMLGMAWREIVAKKAS